MSEWLEAQTESVLCRLPARSQEDMRFVTLLRHAHVLPFAPLPHSKADADSTAGDTMYAVLQPIDHISRSVLEDISLAHADRAAHRASAAAQPPAGVVRDPGQQLQAALAAADKQQAAPKPPQNGAAGDAGVDGQPAKRPRVADNGSEASAPPQEAAAPAAQAAAAQPAGGAPVRGNQYTAFTVLIRHLLTCKCVCQCFRHPRRCCTAPRPNDALSPWVVCSGRIWQPSRI